LLLKVEDILLLIFITLTILLFWKQFSTYKRLWNVKKKMKIILKLFFNSFEIFCVFYQTKNVWWCTYLWKRTTKVWLSIWLTIWLGFFLPFKAKLSSLPLYLFSPDWEKAELFGKICEKLKAHKETFPDN
jgi:hypothetical protein